MEELSEEEKQKIYYKRYYNTLQTVIEKADE